MGSLSPKTDPFSCEPGKSEAFQSVTPSSVHFCAVEQTQVSLTRAFRQFWTAPVP